MARQTGSSPCRPSSGQGPPCRHPRADLPGSLSSSGRFCRRFCCFRGCSQAVRLHGRRACPRMERQPPWWWPLTFWMPSKRAFLATWRFSLKATLPTWWASPTHPSLSTRSSTPTVPRPNNCRPCAASDRPWRHASSPSANVSPFASLDDLARRVRGVGVRRLRQWQEAGLLVSPRQPGGVQDRAVHGHRGHARSVGARAADTQGTEVRGANAQSTHVMGANALGAPVQGTQAPGAPVPVGAATAHPGRISIPPPGHAEATDHPIEVIRGNPRLPPRTTTARPGSATRGRSGAGRSAAGRSSAERSAAGRSSAERHPAGPHPGDATQALSRSASATGARKASRARGPRADDPSCRTQRRIHQRRSSGKGAQVRRSKAPPLFDDRPLFDCDSIFDERSRLLPRG